MRGSESQDTIIHYVQNRRFDDCILETLTIDFMNIGYRIWNSIPFSPRVSKMPALGGVQISFSLQKGF